MKHLYSPMLRIVAIYLLINFAGTLCFPTIAYALTAGPNSPEFSSFTPVGSNEMVNTFTGDFNYNLPVIEVPGPHGSGYSLSLSYNSGATMEQEASWVGFGWTLNPGSITRNLRGFPDEYDGSQSIDYYNKSRPDWTATSSTLLGLEIFSKDLSVGLSIGSVHRINNYTGYQNVKQYGINFNGCVGVNAQKDANGTTFQPYVSPQGLFNSIFKKQESYKTAIDHRDAKCKRDVQNKRENGDQHSIGSGGFNLSQNGFAMSLVPPTPAPFNYPKYTGFSVNWSISGGINPTQLPIGIEAGKAGTFSYRFNEPKTTAQAYGYNHTPGDGKKEMMMDYYVEKNSPFKAADYFIGIPHGSHDVFSVTGEGIMGGFRSFMPSIGHFSPNQTTSHTVHSQAGFEFMLGVNAGVGLDLGAGYQNTKVKNWVKSESSASQTPIYRFNNDMGGEVIYNDTDLERAGLEVHGGLPGTISANATDVSNYKRAHTGSSAHVEPIQGNLSKGLHVVNKDGLSFIYDEPVLVRNETTLSVDIRKSHALKNRHIAFADLKLSQESNGKFIVKDNEDALRSSTHGTVVGQINPNAYASNFLLTQILTPSYIDADLDKGPSDGDYGGWTKFEYEPVYGEGKDWYRYRMPYNGLLYQQNSISDIKDDLGSVETGEKEIKYLKKIETKTHVAYFVTNKTENTNPYLSGSGLERLDGVGAIALSDTDDPASNVSEGTNSFGDTNLRRLEKIVIFAKTPADPAAAYEHEGQKPLKVVRFEYDYSLVPNVPNNVNSNYSYLHDQNALKEDNGKLTLRKVWVEYEGVVSAKISPYVFNYHYPKFETATKLSTLFPPEYQQLSDDLQNPAYAPYTLDAWGNSMPNAEERKANGIVWTDQSAFLDENLAFDPATYHLKSIQLPSGGTIHVQYETKDYAYVQDRSAMAMARVRPVKNISDASYPSYGEDTYLVSVEDLGVDPSNDKAVDDLVKKINVYFDKEKVKGVETGNYLKKISYKFLFSLLGETPSLDNPLSEYITGYADFKGAKPVVINDGLNGEEKKYGVQVVLGGSGLNKDGNSVSLTPRNACREFVVNRRQGKVAAGDCVEPTFERKYDDIISDAANKSGFESLLKYAVAVEILAKMSIGYSVSQYGNFTKEDSRIGHSIHPDLSFLKLPVYRNKIGGGARVKRILLHDAGFEAGDEVVLGTEYKYVLEDGITSSGVATNEPGLAREENPLIDFLPSHSQNWKDRLVAGDILEQAEGPLGEALLPGPTIGYRRIIMENIHKGQTGNGFSIDEYYTVYDYPFDKYYSYDEEDTDYDFAGKANDRTELKKASDDFKIYTGLFNFIMAKQWAVQGYRFIQTNMHGLPKKMATYSGSYVEYMSQSNAAYLVSGQEYEYFEPGEKIDVVGFDADYTLQSNKVMPGKEMDIARESKRIVDTSIDFNVEIDLSLGISFLPPIFVGVFPSFSFTENELCTHSTSKVISYPSILKSTTSTIEGISSKSENLAFDVSTGDPVLVKSTDSYDGVIDPGSGVENASSVYALNIPASWIYKEMGAKSKNIANTNQLNQKVMSFLVHNTNPLEENSTWLTQPHNLLSAAITTYRDNWGAAIMSDEKISQDYPLDQGLNTPGNTPVDQLNEQWLPKETYTYNTALDAQSNVKNQGVFQLAEPLPWNLTDLSNNWIKASEVTKYSANSTVIEEKDALGIPSAVAYGDQYGHNVPVMVANNADYNTILFEDFEGIETEQERPSHSGKKAEYVTALSNLLPGVKVTQLLKEQGGLMKFWVNADVEGLKLKINNAAPPAENDPLPETGISLQKIASVNGWSLYQGIIDKRAHLGGVVIAEDQPLVDIMASIYIDGDDGSGLEDLLIDDIRFQPLNASSTCFVYDVKNLRLLTQFDDQHFGLFYQYDREGKLVRKLVETERGCYTIQEVNYNTPKQLRASN